MIPTMRSRARLRMPALVLALASLTSCGYDGVTSLPLPFREGTGDDALTVTVRLEEASGLTANSEVKVNDVTVGSVDSISVDGWAPVAVVRLEPDVHLPANALARVGQKSLLGAKYLELAAPDDARPRGRLISGTTIAMSARGNYPETEQVLASLSLVLNGGGLQQVRTITNELDQVLAGRESQAAGFIRRFNGFIGSLNRQRHDLVAVIGRLDSLSRTLSADHVVADALDHLPTALETLDRERAQLTRAMTSLSRFGTTARQVISESGEPLLTNLRNLRPALDGLARAGSDLTESLSVAATYPFPGNTSFPRMFQGDYGNLFITLDVSPARLRRNLLQGFQLTPGGDSLFEGPPLGAGDGPPVTTEAPSILPDLPLLPDLTGAVGDTTGSLPLSGLLPGLLSQRTTTQGGDR